jgi:hypothetical protein
MAVRFTPPHGRNTIVHPYFTEMLATEHRAALLACST